MEDFKGILKSIFHAVYSINLNYDFYWVLEQALGTYNRRPNSTCYAPVLLPFGIVPDNKIEPYVCEAIVDEEATHTLEIVKINNSKKKAQLNMASGKASRDKIRSYLQETKARLRVYIKGEWVLRQRKREHKVEPFYDVTFLVSDATKDNGYIFRTPGVILENKFHGQ